MWRDAPGGLVPTRTSRAEGWVALLPTGRLSAIAGALFAAGLIYWPSSAALAGLWSDTENRAYTHGYLILLTSLWLIFRDRRQVEAAPLRPQPLALLAVLPLSALWLIAWRAGVQDLHLVVLPALVFSALLAVLGWSVARVLLFPLGFLYFALPLWGDLVGILQHLSVEATHALIWLTGLPAYMDGNFVHLPAGSLEIADGCSGLHFLIVGLAMAALYGELSRDSLLRRIAWLCLMGGLAIVANWLRIFVIVAAAYATAMKTFLVTVDHYWFGWLVFAATFAAFLWIANRSAGAHGPESVKPLPAATTGRRSSGLTVQTCAAALACMAVLPVLIYAADLRRPAAASTVAIDWPQQQGAWQGPRLQPTTPWRPEFRGATASALREYMDASGRPVELFAVAYRTQRQGMELVTYDNSLLGDDTLRLLDERIVNTRAGAWREATVMDASGEQSIIWSQYRIGERAFVRPHASQLWYGITALASQPVSSLLALRTVCESGCEPARTRLEAAASSLLPTLRLKTAQQEQEPLS